MMNNLEELSKPVAEVNSKYGDPEAFGERELNVLADIQKMPYRTKFYSQEYVDALIAQLEAAQKEIHDLKMKLSDAGCLLVEWKHRVEQSEYTDNKAEAALSAAQLDATRWRAFLSSPAIRILGHAGLQDDKPIDGHYCHFGMEVWSHYEPYYDNKKAGELITRYADNMIAAS
ncbi:TPA: hypothetical protein ACGBQ6_004492, partial [Yersinia enterocolitica]